MNSQQIDEKAVFNAARQIEQPGTRDEFLEQACGGDEKSIARVRALLDAFEGQQSFLESAPSGLVRTTDFAVDEQPGAQIGAYKLLQQIGEGGFGVVYMAEQIEPVRRKVALKIIKEGMDTKQVVARFEAERQALAMMNHPNIAKVLDGGATESGRPYFVMELVNGVPITEYCDKNKLSNTERLRLFIPVCQAIQHAHHKGVIHRDIKPGNVMVTLNDGVPHPMVIDFGIAKATNQRLTEQTLFTNYAQMIGTPAYMSPEQAEMSKLDIDTRSDVYSLGVLLYELLTGTTPFPAKELLSKGYAEMQRIICEQEPPKPSSLMSTMRDEQRTVVAKNRSVDAVNMGKLLRGELDWILMRALEKDRTRRYETVSGFATDLERHLNNEPVSAAAPSLTYQLQKFVHKNRKYVRAAVGVAVLLVVTTLAASWQAVRATQAHEDAESARAAEREQRVVSQQKQKEAEAARKAEHRQRVLAQQNEASARRLLYAADMRAAQDAITGHDLDRSLKLLARHVPARGAPDLRGWEWRYLWRQCQSEYTAEIGDLPSPVHSLSVSHDGALAAAGRFGRHDGKSALAIWDLRTHKRLPNTPNAQGRVRTAFSPTSRLLAFCTQSAPHERTHRVALWDASRGEIVDEIELEGTCEGIAFNGDGSILFVAQHAPGKSAIVRRDVAGRLPLPSLPVPNLDGSLGVSESFSVARSGRLAAYVTRADSEAKAQVLDLETGTTLWSKPVASGEWISCLALSNDGSVLATAGGGGREDPVLWDARTGERLSSLPGHLAMVKEVTFWPDGSKLATACEDQTIRIWDLADPRQPSLSRTLRGCRSEVWQLALENGGATLVSGDYQGRVLAWRPGKSSRRPHKFILPIESVLNLVFSEDSQAIITLDNQGIVTRWSGPEFEFKERLFEVGGNLAPSSFLADRFLATATTDGYVEIWDVRTRKSLYPRRRIAPFLIGALILDDRHVIAATATGDVRYHLETWNLATNERVGRRHFGPATQPFGAASLDGRWTLTPIDGRGALLEDRDGQRPNVTISSSHPIHHAAFSRDGSLFALAYLFGTGRIYETATVREKVALSENLRSFHSAAFSPDNTRLFTTGDKMPGVHLWHVDSGQPLLRFDTTASASLGARMSPDGNLLLSVRRDGVSIRRAPSFDEIAAESTDVAD